MVGVFFIICFINALVSPIYVSHLNETFESKIRAFSNSFDSFIQTIFIALGFYLYGEMTARVGFSVVVQCSFIIPLIAVILSNRYLTKLRNG
jgi:hypothetical protein